MKNYNLPIPRPPQSTSKLQKKHSSLKGEHPAFQNMKFLNFFYFSGSFLPSWIRIRIPNTDPDPKPCTERIRYTPVLRVEWELWITVRPP